MKKFLIMLCLAAATVMSAAAQEKFPMITIPEDVTDPLLRAKYLSDHFWENVDFETASDDLIADGLSELLPILRIVDYDAMTASWAAAVKQAEESKTGVAHLLKVSRIRRKRAMTRICTVRCCMRRLCRRRSRRPTRSLSSVIL